MSPLSPYLNVDPRYLVQVSLGYGDIPVRVIDVVTDVFLFQDTDEFILPTGANKTRGRFELAFFTIGGSCMTGTSWRARVTSQSWTVIEFSGAQVDFYFVSWFCPQEPHLVL